ncbi:unnamed protein product, partial [Owenia fusiformis]
GILWLQGQNIQAWGKFKDECNKCICNFNLIQDFVTCSKKNCERQYCKRTICPNITCPQGSHIPPRRCCPVCNMKLPKVIQIDLTNKAVPKVCNGDICEMHCRNGHQKDNDGCNICDKCNKDPCLGNRCSGNTTCDVINGTAACRKCSRKMCGMYCQFGFQTDGNGCEICKCKTNPCLVDPRPCQKGSLNQVCVVRNNKAVCEKHPALACAHPEKDTTGYIKICTDTKNCSDDYICLMSRGQFPGVCCPLAQCRYFLRLYNINEIVPSLDGCNTCCCMGDGKIGCTTKTCPKRGCANNGNNYIHEESFPRGDGCNTCKCSDGDVDCTKAYCAHCEENGLLYAVGEYVNRNDPCLICQCTNNPLDITSAKIVCAVRYSCTQAPGLTPKLSPSPDM